MPSRITLNANGGPEVLGGGGGGGAPPAPPPPPPWGGGGWPSRDDCDGIPRPALQRTSVTDREAPPRPPVAAPHSP
ncbi:hypothetical protein I5I78_26200, partial [Pseudomonas aeruginosa]|nr:hypothetical protein [Pseudomonas aeruginosa]